MNAKQSLVGKIVTIGSGFWSSEEKWKARGLFALLVLLLIAVNGLNVIISYTGRDFYQALQGKEVDAFFYHLTRYSLVFVVGTPIVVLYSYVNAKLSLAWRRWLANYLIGRYFAARKYYRIANTNSVDNPDERLTEDVSSFCSTALSLFLAVGDSIIGLISFSVILWTMSSTLMFTAFGYAVLGSLVSLWFGVRLAKLNFQQSKLEGDLRFSLARVRLSTEQIAFYGGEEREKSQVLKALSAALRNASFLIGWNRNLNFFQTPYGYFIGLVPILVLATMYFRAEIEFGEIMQANMAFGQVLAALTLIVNNIRGLSSFKANVERLSAFTGELESEEAGGTQIARNTPADTSKETGKFAQAQNAGTVSVTDLTVETPDGERTVIKDLNFSVSPGQRLLIVGPSGVGKSSLARAIAALWTRGRGQIVAPSLKKMVFIPQQPYMPEGTIREQLVYPNARYLTDEETHAVLAKFNLSELPKRFGGVDTVHNWQSVLSLGEQQRLALARAYISGATAIVLDEATSALDTENEGKAYQLLCSLGTTVISVGHRHTLFDYHDMVLELNPSDPQAWKLVETDEYLKNR